MSTNNDETIEQSCLKCELEIESFKFDEVNDEEFEKEVDKEIIVTILEKGESVYDIDGNEVLTKEKI